jgi:hypothetical protein
VLVPDELRDLAQVGAGAQELGGEDVPERVRGHALALVEAGRVDVLAKDLSELRVERFALDADEDGLLDQRHARRVVLSEKRRERGMDRDCPLAASLRAAHTQEAPGEVDVVPLEP